jgi:hypothetical protein
MAYKATKFQAFFAEKSAARLCFFENFPMQMNLVVKIKLDGWRCGKKKIFIDNVVLG